MPGFKSQSLCRCGADCISAHRHLVVHACPTELQPGLVIYPGDSSERSHSQLVEELGFELFLFTLCLTPSTSPSTPPGVMKAPSGSHSGVSLLWEKTSQRRLYSQHAECQNQSYPGRPVGSGADKQGSRIRMLCHNLGVMREVLMAQPFARTRVVSQDYTESSHHNIKMILC